MVKDHSHKILGSMAISLEKHLSQDTTTSNIFQLSFKKLAIQSVSSITEKKVPESFTL